MLQQAQPDDYVIATGKTHSIREFLNLAAEILEISNLDSKVRIDPTLYRPAEVDLLIGDASKAAKQLGWYPQVGFYELVKKMVLNDLAREAEISGKPVPKLNIK
jgi:GDPmannose 4,6-dehydratase